MKNIQASNLITLRKEIDTIDKDILSLIGKRFLRVEKIGKIKKKLKKPIQDKKREEEKIMELAKQGESLGIEKAIIEKVWKTFFKLAYKLEK